MLKKIIISSTFCFSHLRCCSSDVGSCASLYVRGEDGCASTCQHRLDQEADGSQINGSRHSLGAGQRYRGGGAAVMVGVMRVRCSSASFAWPPLKFCRDNCCCQCCWVTKEQRGDDVTDAAWQAGKQLSHFGAVPLFGAASWRRCHLSGNLSDSWEWNEVANQSHIRVGNGSVAPAYPSGWHHQAPLPVAPRRTSPGCCLSKNIYIYLPQSHLYLKQLRRARKLATWLSSPQAVSLVTI